MSQKIIGVPSNLEEAVDMLLAYYERNLSIVSKILAGQFLTSAHFAAGTFMRNNWCLFWYEEHPHQDSWPAEKPPLVQWFNDRGIREADSMSEEVLRALWHKVNGSITESL